MVVNDVVNNVLEFIFLNNLFKVVFVEGINFVCCKVVYWVFLLFYFVRFFGLDGFFFVLLL